MASHFYKATTVDDLTEKILQRDPNFGKRCLDYFNSLNLNHIRAQKGREKRCEDFFQLFGFTPVPEELVVGENTHLAYGIGRWSFSHEGIVFRAGYGKQGDMFHELDSGVFLTAFHPRGITSGGVHQVYSTGAIKEIKFNRYVLDKIIETREALLSK